MKRARRTLAAVALSCLGAACGPAQVPLLVRSQPADADVFIDDKFVGAAHELAQKRVRVTPGTHRLEVRRPGYYRHYGELVVGEKDRRVEATVTLRRAPAGETDDE